MPVFCRKSYVSLIQNSKRDRSLTWEHINNRYPQCFENNEAFKQHINNSRYYIENLFSVLEEIVCICLIAWVLRSLVIKVKNVSLRSRFEQHFTVRPQAQFVNILHPWSSKLMCFFSLKQGHVSVGFIQFPFFLVSINCLF